MLCGEGANTASGALGEGGAVGSGPEYGTPEKDATSGCLREGERSVGRQLRDSFRKEDRLAAFEVLRRSALSGGSGRRALAQGLPAVEEPGSDREHIRPPLKVFPAWYSLPARTAKVVSPSGSPLTGSAAGALVPAGSDACSDEPGADRATTRRSGACHTCWAGMLLTFLVQ